jgi:solute carrier family 13 (sodium-dependent dicarboxylate transporter), member 2/3/5
MVGKAKDGIMLFAGPVAGGILAWALTLAGWPLVAGVTAGVTLWCALWWIAEPVPIPATSLLPVALFPLFGVLTPEEVAEAYGNPMILLFLGGFILSTGMERSGAHRQIALLMVHLFGGGSQRRVVYGFMAAAAFLSMWISNTATALMLLPIVLAVLQNNPERRFAVALLLGVSYACSLGGVGTPIGTPPNLIFMRVYTETTGIELSFLDWMLWAMPVVLIFLPLMAYLLTRKLRDAGGIVLPAVAGWTPEQRRVLVVFACTALLWITRTEPFGGWSVLLNLPAANDAVVALLAAVLMFVLPNGRGGKLLDWESANRIPWGILLLFAGGIAIAKAFEASGLADRMADSLTSLETLPVLLMIVLVCLMVTFLTEVTSNTATTSLLLPVLAAVSAAMEIDPALLMLPAALSASCAFMLPVATPPNAIVFASGMISIRQMVRHGFALNLIGAAVVSAVVYVALG